MKDNHYDENLEMQEEKVEISREEYEKLKKIENDTTEHRTKLYSIYDKINIPLKVLDMIIVGGIIFIIGAVIYGMNI